ncbi:DUF7344 domain-containing protein [Halobellus sp. GM3]|uniref:DUF7344 domain-containing protein n=1 Tax=Halobellus sp. GM3 TaxID=3458410 RepID=UPI00403D5DAB
MSSDSDGLRTTEALKLLASDERRRLLRELHERDGDRISIHRTDTLETLSGDESDSPSAGDPRSVERLEIELYHNHLPRLADVDVITWDREADTVAPGPAFEDLRPLVAWFVENDE